MNIDGFLDIYNWKDTKTVKLVPNTESVATLVNKMVKGEIRRLTNDPEAVKQYMVQQDGEYYVHLGIIRLATGAFSENKTIINGAESIDYKLRGFPIPEFAKIIAKTCDLVSYHGESKNMAVGPKDTLADNENLYQDLYFGREAK